MPAASAALWASAIGLIGIMGVIIGYLVNKGFDTIKASIEKEFQTLWAKFEKFQEAHQFTAASLHAHREADALKEKFCLERHRKMEDEQRELREKVEHMEERKGDRRNAEQEL